MIIVYTGNGKGKTSACVGQALRALGQNFTVFFAQFMKSGNVAGEQRLLSQLLGDAFFCKVPIVQSKHVWPCCSLCVNRRILYVPDSSQRPDLSL